VTLAMATAGLAPEHLADIETCPAAQARAARAIIETALDAAGWPWRRRLSLWLDMLVRLEERER
jgi:hypothetical protein